jgi:hypothetical protein
MARAPSKTLPTILSIGVVLVLAGCGASSQPSATTTTPTPTASSVTSSASATSSSSTTSSASQTSSTEKGTLPTWAASLNVMEGPSNTDPLTEAQIIQKFGPPVKSFDGDAAGVWARCLVYRYNNPEVGLKGWILIGLDGNPLKFSSQYDTNLHTFESPDVPTSC